MRNLSSAMTDRPFYQKPLLAAWVWKGPLRNQTDRQAISSGELSGLLRLRKRRRSGREALLRSQLVLAIEESRRGREEVPRVQLRRGKKKRSSKVCSGCGESWKVCAKPL